MSQRRPTARSDRVDEYAVLPACRRPAMMRRAVFDPAVPTHGMNSRSALIPCEPGFAQARVGSPSAGLRRCHLQLIQTARVPSAALRHTRRPRWRAEVRIDADDLEIEHAQCQ